MCSDDPMHTITESCTQSANTIVIASFARDSALIHADWLWMCTVVRTLNLCASMSSCCIAQTASQHLLLRILCRENGNEPRHYLCTAGVYWFTQDAFCVQQMVVKHPLTTSGVCRCQYRNEAPLQHQFCRQAERRVLISSASELWLQCVVVWCIVVQCVAVCCVLQCVAVCFSVV